MSQTFSIIGAGIGGLTTGLSLRQQGLQVALYESAPAIRPVGAGIIIANNAMQVYRKLGLQEQVEKAGNRISAVHITDRYLKTISAVDLRGYEQQYGVQNIAIHRGALQRLLAQELGHEHIHLSRRLSGIDKGEYFTLRFEDGTSLKSKVIIGADGIRSVVREELFEKGRLRDAGQICWRGVCTFELSHKYHHEAVEAWGKGTRFGFVRISAHEVYWYALANAKNVNRNEVVLEELFSGYHRDILDLISATPEDHIFVSDILDLQPVKTWQRGNVCLVGDAAHATTPNLGQGACQAIEDAYVLGQLLANGTAMAQAFQAYEKLRRKKAHYIVNTSWRLGKMAQLENGCAIAWRNFVLRNLPEAVNQKQMELIFRLDDVKKTI